MNREEKKVVIGIKASHFVPRRQPRIIPMTVPTTKAIIVAKPTKPMVHGRDWLIICDTGVGNDCKDTPKLP